MAICNLEIKIYLIPFYKFKLFFVKDFLADIESIIKVWGFFFCFQLKQHFRAVCLRIVSCKLWDTRKNHICAVFCCKHIISLS